MGEPTPLRALPRTAEGGAERLPDHLDLALVVRDPEVIRALAAHPEGRARTEAALAALRIGVLALEHARGRIDAEAIRREGERLLKDMATRLETHRETVQGQVASALQAYFDPANGRFTERVERLVRRDGELEVLLRRQIGGDDSTLARTLAAHVGAESPLLRLLKPDEAEGVVRQMAASVERVLAEQKERILEQFSLDNREGALSRLVLELTERHGKLTDALRGSVEKVVGEFSLDNKEGALSRLVERVEDAQGRIQKEFTLDAQDSALARMRRDLMEVLEAHRRTAAAFQEEVKTALATLQARREESQRSTRHGADFEASVFAAFQHLAQQAGDVAEQTGATVGVIKNCKVGDVVLTVGPDSRAAGARIVVEAKEDASYDLVRARAEMETARKNRQAGLGVFVFSARTAPEGLRTLARYGSDLVVVWNADDPTTDVVLEAAVAAARALAVREATQREGRAADLEGIERAIRAVEKQADALEDIRRAADTVRTGGERILDRVRIAQTELRRQVANLDGLFGDLRQDLAGGTDGA